MAVFRNDPLPHPPRGDPLSLAAISLAESGSLLLQGEFLPDLLEEAHDLHSRVPCPQGFEWHITAISGAVDDGFDFPQIGRLLLTIPPDALLDLPGDRV